jgi:ABC-type branched-subunit amino acid transport system substrate-binding protein
MLRRAWLVAGLAAMAAGALPVDKAAAQGCTVKIGLVMELTGPAAPYGQAGAKAVEMAFRDINDAGGVLGCKLSADLRDSESQGTVAVDAARQLVDVGHVPHHLLHHPADPHIGDGAREGGADFAGILIADAHRTGS